MLHFGRSPWVATWRGNNAGLHGWGSVSSSWILFLSLPFFATVLDWDSTVRMDCITIYTLRKYWISQANCVIARTYNKADSLSDYFWHVNVRCLIGPIVLFNFIIARDQFTIRHIPDSNNAEHFCSNFVLFSLWSRRLNHYELFNREMSYIIDVKWIDVKGDMFSMIRDRSHKKYVDSVRRVQCTVLNTFM